MQGFDPWSGNQDPSCRMALVKNKNKQQKNTTSHQNKQTKTRERAQAALPPPGGSPGCSEEGAPQTRSRRLPPHFATATANTASGVQVADEVCLIFYDSQVRKCSPPEEIKKRKKAVLFCLSADKKCIIV